MRKKLFNFSVLLAVFLLPLKGWGHALLELDDTERDGKKLFRVYQNVRDFYEENKTAIGELKKKDFFRKPSDHASVEVASALSRIKQNRKCSIVRTYGDDYPQLNKDLRNLLDVLEPTPESDLEESDLKNLKKYIGGILTILKYVSVNKL